MRIGNSYKQQAITDNWDVIIIGSGIGGLAAAAMLARHLHKRVLVLERHYTAGGFTHTFTRPGYEWDVGVHYVGDVHRPSSLMRRVFDHLSDGQLLWADMGEVYDTIIINGDRYEFPRGEQAFVARMKEYFPSYYRAIDRYMARIKSAAKNSSLFFMEKALPSFVPSFIGSAMRWPALRDARHTLAHVFSKLGIPPGSRIAGVLSGQLGDYGLAPQEASFFMHAILVKHYLRGAAYPIGGSSQIARSILPAIENKGGKVMISAEVDSIIFEGTQARGVLMADGRKFFAPQIISDAGWSTTWGKLVPQELRKSYGLSGKISGVPPSLGHAALYIGARKDSQELKLSASNIWVYPHEDHDKNIQAYLKNPKAPLPLVYLSFPAAKDPTFSTRFPHRSTIEVIGVMPWEWLIKYSDTRLNKRGENYNIFKQELTERLLSILYEQCPALQGCVDYAELSTPLSTRHFTGHPQGEIYGLSHVPARFMNRSLRPQTPFAGLYLTGSDICTAGVGGALMGGLITASVIAKRNLLSAALSGS
jgi:all-trans-retinol 13,14-reductase